MTDDFESTEVLKFAQSLLRSGQIGGSLVIKTGRIRKPIAIRSSDGKLHSWFVPVAVEDHLAGFLQVLPDLTLMRYAAFQRREDSMEGCPSVESWTDATTIRRVAQERARPGEAAGAPVLTYDQVPSRLAWAVPMAAHGNAPRTLLVAGQQVWEASVRDGGISSYGGSPAR
jgi:hypothetical protein